jgi:hypothetical protein
MGPVHGADASLRRRNEDLFRDLEGRALTAEEEQIIAQRVALQRSMADLFETRERARKARPVSRGRPPSCCACGAARALPRGATLHALLPLKPVANNS